MLHGLGLTYTKSGRVDEGIADHGQIDQLMVDCFRWPAGPFGMARGAGSGWR